MHQNDGATDSTSITFFPRIMVNDNQIKMEVLPQYLRQQKNSPADDTLLIKGRLPPHFYRNMQYRKNIEVCDLKNCKFNRSDGIIPGYLRCNIAFLKCFSLI